MQHWDDWVDAPEVPPSLMLPYLVKNVRRICDSRGNVLDSFVSSHWCHVLKKHIPSNIAFETRLTGWVGDVAQNRFYMFVGMFRGVNDDAAAKSFQLWLQGGYYDVGDEAIVEDDNVRLAVSLDDASIAKASDAVRDGREISEISLRA